MKNKSLAALALLLSSTICLTACGENANTVAKSTSVSQTAETNSASEKSSEAASQSSAEKNQAEASSENANKTLSYEDASIITLSTDSAALDGEAIQEYDYTWHCDPTTVHDEVKNAPAEYYTGEKPETDAACYIDHELYYYPVLPEESFSLVNYDGEQEWVSYYSDGENDKYIFSTLPNLNRSLPTDMMHSEEEASKNKVLHITSAGTYVLSGSWNGQIYVDLGEDATSDPDAVVTLVLENADINCTVAPGIVFKNVYECDNAWEDRDEYSAEVDTENAGARVLIADGSENTVTGCNIFRMLKTKYKDDEDSSQIKVQKKQRKIDAAFYSYMTMNIYGGEAGNGKLTVNSSFEGLDSELHLSVYGGDITIYSQDDGMNVNEDNVSVITFYGGNVTINAALGAEGDGVDSNGFIKIDGGTVSVNGIRVPDSALDSDCGIYYYSGSVIIDGEEQAYESGAVFNETGRMGEGPGGPMGEGPGGPMNGGNFGPGNKPDGDFDPSNRPTPPDGNFNPGNRPTPPDGSFNPGDKPDGNGMPTPPDGDFDPNNRPTPPDGNFDPDNRPTPLVGDFDPNNKA